MFGLSNAFPAHAPQPLRDLLTSVPSEHQPLPPATKDFKQNIRAYNSALQMASTGLHIHSPEQGISMIAIKGVVHHLLGPLQPVEHDVPQFTQLYIIDSMDAQVTARLAVLGVMGAALHQLTLAGLQHMLHDHNTLCSVSNKSWTCPHTTCLNGKLSSGSTSTLTSDATMLLPPPKWLGCSQVKFFSNVYYCVVCLLPLYI
jgi:hypothetical protein